MTEKIPIKKPTESEAALFEKLVSMVQMAKREGLDIEAAFLEELIDACVLELYFPEEAAAKDLQFITATAVCLEKTSAPLSKVGIRDFVGHCSARGLGEKLNRLETESPDLFAVIQKEGTV